tara:strand:- start:7070 stop:7219 length:150 start_codon:yes stop_codon:yes gene_type:complete
LIDISNLIELNVSEDNPLLNSMKYYLDDTHMSKEGIKLLSKEILNTETD